MSRFVSLRDFDWFLLGMCLLICLIGTVEIYSTTAHTKFADMHVKQLEWIAGGIVVMFCMSMVNYHVLLENAHWAYLASIASHCWRCCWSASAIWAPSAGSCCPAEPIFSPRNG